MTVFIDLPADDLQAGTAFWSEVTGSVRFDPWGADGEFATLEPAEGDPYLGVQRLHSGAGGCHPDFHVPDIASAAKRAQILGAAVAREDSGLVVLNSPAGLPFCLVRHREGQSTVPPPVRWPLGARSRLDQICIDVPPDLFDRELEFWLDLTGWPQTSTDVHEFRRLLPDPQVPLHLLLQRLDDAHSNQGAAAHPDFSCTDVAAETERHRLAGAAAVRRHPHWQVMRDPTGLEYCITDKDPDGNWLTGIALEPGPH
ncbi:VOC family protein [Glycomyces endophyticus]